MFGFETNVSLEICLRKILKVLNYFKLKVTLIDKYNLIFKC